MNMQSMWVTPLLGAKSDFKNVLATLQNFAFYFLPFNKYSKCNFVSFYLA